MRRRLLKYGIAIICFVLYAFLAISCGVFLPATTTTTALSAQPGQAGSIGRGGVVEIPEQIDGDPVTVIEDYAFANMQVTSVNIPSSVTSIGEYAFANNQILNIVIPDKAVLIGNNAFANNRLTNVIIPANVTSIGDSAFISNQLTNIVISDSVTSIGSYAFQTNQLASVNLGNGVKTIGDYAFEYNPLISVTIGNNVSLGLLAIGSGFEGFYDNTDQAAGTYTRPNANSLNWTKTP